MYNAPGLAFFVRLQWAAAFARDSNTVRITRSVFRPDSVRLKQAAKSGTGSCRPVQSSVEGVKNK